jgi:DNA polymerase-3 subunit gamma/tau
LYRRYRPQSFAEVIGQEHVTVPLCAALDKDRVNHAYLFSGPRGCGKTTSARILARCLNCVQGPTPNPCGECPSCIDLARGGPGSLDVVEIDAASHGGVDDARSLRERAAFAPARDRYKVFIIDEAHMVSTQGFNALLKIVEEPPPHVRFVFATTEPEKVIGTIRSRTHHYPFRLVPPERLQAYLAEICEAEGVRSGQGVLPLVVRAGAGSVRDSLSVLDQLIAGTGEEGLTYASAVSLLGYTDAALLDEVVDGLAVGDGRAVFGVLDRVISSGHDPRRFVEDLLERLRDLLVVAAVPDGGHGVLRGLPADQLERMKGQAARFGRAELSRAADVVNAALTEMTGATSPRLQLELLAARLLLPGSEESERGLRARVDRIEKRIGMVTPGVPLATPSSAAFVSSAAGSAPPAAPTGSAPPAASGGPAPVAPPSADAPVAASSQSPPTAGVDAVRRLWPDVLGKLRGMRRMTWTLVSEYAQVLDLDGDRLVLVFDSPGRATSFGRGSHADYLRQALIDVIGLDCQVEAVSGDRAPTRPQTRPAASGPGPTPAARPPDPDTPARPGPPLRGPDAEPPGWEPRAATAPGADPTSRADRASDRRAPGRQPPGRQPSDRQPSDRRPSDPQRPERQPSERARPERQPGGRGVPQGAVGRRAHAAPPDDDVPLPPEPPAEEPPPEDDFDPYARPGGPLSPRRPEPAAPAEGPGEPPAPTADPRRPGPSVGAGSAGAEARSRPSRYMTMRANQTDNDRVPDRGRARVPEGPIVLPDDEPSADDPTIEGSGLMGPSVVAQLLGGRVIEEREA